ncbi:SDR family NAD(P)-dependent oxidoreductase, partial [Massilia cavernae]
MSALNKFEMHGKVALVTGGAGILGQQFAAGLADAGAAVAVVDLDQAAAQAVANKLGGQAAGFGCNVADPESVRTCVAAVLER